MAIPCRCFLFDEDEHIEYDSRRETPYTASLVFTNMARKPNSLRVFTFAELEAATNNFSSSSNIGNGRYGSVYKGVIKSLEHPFDSIQVAVKYAHGVKKREEHKEWLAEVNFLGVIEHPNLVKLIGYCVENHGKGIQLLLVYKYMSNGSVMDHLSIKSETPLSWTTRLKVAQDAARGLAYLNEGMEFKIIFRDFNSSKLLLDDQWNAMLSDMGVARLGYEVVDTVAFVGMAEYSAPEYIQTRYESCKSDIWSYGLFLYELIMGRHPMDWNRPQNVRKLLVWVRPYVQSKNLQPIIDPRLEGMCTPKSAKALAIIVELCLKKNPKMRPKMREVLEMVNRVIGVPSQITSSSALVIRRHKLLKSWFGTVFCCACMHYN